MRTACHSLTRSKWFLPLFSLFLGVVIVGWLVEIAQGRDGNPYGLLGALAGLVYIVAVVALRLRS